MREIRQSGSEGGVGRKPHPYPYPPSCLHPIPETYILVSCIFFSPTSYILHLATLFFSIDQRALTY